MEITVSYGSIIVNTKTNAGVFFDETELDESRIEKAHEFARAVMKKLNSSLERGASIAD